MFISRKCKSITQATVFMAYNRAVDIDTKIEKQKELVQKKKEQYEKVVADLEILVLIQGE